MIDLNISDNYYKILGVRRSSVTRNIQQAYKEKYRNLPARDKIGSLKDYFISLDRALDTLTDINKRSKFDAQWTYNFLKDFAWDKQLLSEKDFKILQRFWSKQHLNQEVYTSLNFDTFVPEYDLKWYIPFYEEAYWKDVKEKEQIYYPSLYRLYFNRFLYLILAALSLIFFVADIVFANILGASLAFVLGLISVVIFFAVIRPMITAFAFARENKTLESAEIVDKWVKLKPGLLPKKYRPKYFVAYETDYGIFYQEVSHNVFNKLKKEMPVDIIVSINNPTKTMIGKTFLKLLERKE